MRVRKYIDGDLFTFHFGVSYFQHIIKHFGESERLSIYLDKVASVRNRRIKPVFI